MPHADRPAVTPQLLARWPLPDPEREGKHARGTVLVVGGAQSTPGAALLAGLAALRVGAGRLQIVTVEATAVPLAVAIPEALVLGVAAGANGSLDAQVAERVAEQADGVQAVVVGPGLLGRDETAALLQALLPRLDQRAAVVLDAVALGALARVPAAAEPVRGRLVLTPNAGEAAELLGDGALTGVDAAQAVAKRYGAVVAAHGGVATPDGRQWSDESGGVGLGTSGSGDVLAGAVAGLLARGAEPAQAAVVGQYLHSAAGDALAAGVGRLGFLARDLLPELPRLLDRLG